MSVTRVSCAVSDSVSSNRMSLMIARFKQPRVANGSMTKDMVGAT